MKKLYPESKVEITAGLARHYDAVLDIATLGMYLPFVRLAIRMANIKPQDRILDLGAGTGRNACLMAEYLSDKGELLGLDISAGMIDRFRKKCAGFNNIKIINRRIDQTLPYNNEFTKVFISFVLHGFPQDVRLLILGNAFNALKPGGEFLILDYNEFVLPELPFYLRIPFKLLECPYAFDFIRKDFKKILAEAGFDGFREHIFLHRFVRLLKARKPGALEYRQENDI